MRNLQLQKSGARLVLALVLGFGLVANASAGTVYSWTTEEGTHSFTNDKKRIPTRYKDAAERRTVGSLESYDRFTPGPKASGEDYAARLERRLGELRDRADREDDRMAQGHHYRHSGKRGRGSHGVKLNWNQNNRRGNSLGLGFPISRLRADDDGPLHVQNVRLPRQGMQMTTHHASVATRGGKVVAIFEAERNDSPLPK